MKIVQFTHHKQIETQETTRTTIWLRHTYTHGFFWNTV